ncbi:ABC-type transport auxiliary lipoprotein family protein [Roseibium sediminicola]|uniref:ABC-type transport auxiliary lipoprotein family protein n=1 Tax=Roseibium sediminicola TaxID=2933272 RepID=A0ABT0GZQ3_9HYPH|nr:ABC-type transport auxiliary lipoprotein family protein [Roseibium sp. CAU 1639]MCK7614914.1 ABC-type transport auxiliary lipoprotein family protein [Roseibium sp. CAU 1639]
MTKTGTDMTRRGVLGALGFGVLVSGCASSAPSAYYGIRAADGSGLAGRASRVQVLVAAPRALKALDTSYIAVVDKGPIYSYFPDSAWADTLPNVVQQKLVETLQNTGRLRGVGVPGDGLLIDYQLQTEIRAFELRVDGTDRGLVEISARVVNDRNGRTVATKVFRAETPSGSTSVDKAVEAMNASADRVFAEMAAWTLRNV